MSSAELSQEQKEARDVLLGIVDSLSSYDKENLLKQAIADLPSTSAVGLGWAHVKQEVMECRFRGWESFAAAVERNFAALHSVDNKKLKLKKNCGNLLRTVRRVLQAAEVSARKALHVWHTEGKDKAEKVRSHDVE